MDCHQGQCKGGGAEGNGNDDCRSGDRCLCELDGLDGNAVVRRHAWQPTDVGPDVILATTNADGTSYFLHDANKSVMQATGGNGEQLGLYAYAPFGEPLGASPARIGFSSELFDTSTRLAYYNYRHLAPGLGRWLGRDAIEEEGGVNLHAFVRNDPIGSLDHLGLACCNGKEYDSKVSCCIDNVVQAKVTDDAGERCCQNEMITIELRNENFIPFLNSGHSFIWIPPRNGNDGVGYGFYPGIPWKIIHGDGVIMSDDFNHKYTKKLTYYYDACPNSVNTLIQGIWDDMKKTYLYRFDGSSRDNVFNCSQMACKWLQDSGFRPPFDPKDKIMPSPFPLEKGGYDPHPERK